MLINTDDYKHLVLQKITEKVLSEIIYTSVVTELCKWIAELQKKNLLLSKIQYSEASEYKYIKVRKLKVASK